EAGRSSVDDSIDRLIKLEGFPYRLFHNEIFSRLFDNRRYHHHDEEFGNDYAQGTLNKGDRNGDNDTEYVHQEDPGQGFGLIPVFVVKIPEPERCRGNCEKKKVA